jgi:DivIVA domain-containing protein
MPPVEFDRQAIERRDFPVTRRGYDPAAVDAHLKGLAAEFEELQRAAAGPGEASLASTAGTQVQSILEAAETAAAEIESQALEHARSVRLAADHSAERTREEAIERARAHTAAVERAAAALLERVESIDGEAERLVESLRAGGGRLAGDLGALERGMGELYDAASGRAAAPGADAEPSGSTDAEPSGSADAEPSGSTDAELPTQTDRPATDSAAAGPAASGAGSRRPAARRDAGTGPEAAEPASIAPAAPKPPIAAAAEPAPAAAQPSPAGGGDLDGARLIALNMALNGESREDAERYLATHFESIDRVKLIDEVYAAIEA